MLSPRKQPSEGRKTLNVRLPITTLDHLKKTAKMAAGHPTYSTISSIVEAGIQAELQRLEKLLATTYPDLAHGFDHHDADPPPARIVHRPSDNHVSPSRR